MWTKFHQKYIDIIYMTYVDKISPKICRQNGQLQMYNSLI
jgi:hypothetical protein